LEFWHKSCKDCNKKSSNFKNIDKIRITKYMSVSPARDMDILSSFSESGLKDCGICYPDKLVRKLGDEKIPDAIIS